MPIMKGRMEALKKQYGDEKGESIYHAMEKEGKNTRKKKKAKKNIFK